MDIEKRVESLEGDLKLLKNEVKQILLDIREQLIEGTPNLSEEPSSGEVGVGGEEKATIPTRSQREDSIDLDIVTAVGSWMAEKVKKFGTERMVEILNLYQLTGRLTDGVKEVLARLLQLDEHHDGSGLSSGDSAALLKELDDILSQARAQRRKEGHG